MRILPCLIATYPWRNGMWPELLKLPWLEVSIWSYGLMLATAFIAGLWMATRIGARDGLMTSEVYKLGLCLIP